MSEQQSKDALLGYVKELCFYINNGMATILEYGYDADIEELIRDWELIRYTILCELGIA